MVAQGTGIIIQDEEPEAGALGLYLTYCWFKPSTNTWHVRRDSRWEVVHVLDFVTMPQLIEALSGVAPVDHSHPTHGDIDFTGTISVNGDKGLTGKRTVGGYTLEFKSGILVGFVAP